MNNIIALIVKFVTCLVAYAVGLDLFFNATWMDIVLFSVLMTVVSYLAGDRILLSRIGNKNALIADFLLSYMVVWIFGSVLLDNYLQIAWGSIISALIITTGEYFVHRLLIGSMREGNRNRNLATDRLAYGMEMSEEHEPLKKK
ncbi:YndM family protein [Neobacillus ginsengisoli]|uniref:Membrane protein implicated in regulation of membrane protease activity n=1 Tax=Neobacillus ginsengisoli TaxID=904295 RepID=A0ABT9XWY0_9BACI|nr:YndM family protein [Neobacillus ginsengisoli]MDQ0200077.1 membrane protein implicated in regulation of membrane protease activity [Neobacillus ginsengisoli]